MSEAFYFIRQLGQSFASIGAVMPTSRYAARAMAAQVARRRGPKAILEVGPGTGAITAAIVRQLQPGDRLVLCEINAEFVAYLRQRFEREPAFRAVRDQVTILHGDVTQMSFDEAFDVIVSAVPFNTCPPEVVRALMERYRALLTPDGVLTYIEYAWLGALKRRLPGVQRAQIAGVQAVLAPYIKAHQVRRDLVWRNLPPAWVRHLRFSTPPVEAALHLQPDEDYRRVALGAELGIAADALPWLAGLSLAATLLRRPRLLRRLAWGALAPVAAFFRDPRRAVPSDPAAALAASDGRVLRVERVRDARFGPEEWLRIVVFLSLTDVHINRSPLAGRVREVVHETGGYAAADSAAAEHNAACYTVLDTPYGACVVAQRVGLVARRIVNWATPGDLLAQGERFGLIRFGSRTDVYLPADRFAARVVPGMVVRAGRTVLAQAICEAAR
ncbi:phosphatidylserine decarboxylase [Kallotenue papyrolyticum]|uniref:phosphatidylserine decarboxylase n=1 Tax=Kallotenue papyrolyticum TaxID=1325125 RepID=UPI0004786451|nr:phosphatidylserine decarboxylase [Kallotenue papyrolyticum]